MDMLTTVSGGEEILQKDLTLTTNSSSSSSSSSQPVNVATPSNPPSTSSDLQVVTIGCKLLVKNKIDGAWRSAEILSIRDLASREFYVHYVDFNKRLDEWVPASHLDLSTIDYPKWKKKSNTPTVATTTATHTTNTTTTTTTTTTTYPSTGLQGVEKDTKNSTGPTRLLKTTHEDTLTNTNTNTMDMKGRWVTQKKRVNATKIKSSPLSNPKKKLKKKVKVIADERQLQHSNVSTFSEELLTTPLSISTHSTTEVPKKPMKEDETLLQPPTHLKLKTKFKKLNMDEENPKKSHLVNPALLSSNNHTLHTSTETSTRHPSGSLADDSMEPSPPSTDAFSAISKESA
ncbi:3-ketoacyl-CoA thiolase 5, peroxisomal [Coelomomyces lativittatus]|nr:3-ketoacyl-CoA thiolase 5, peroxisomal [Coelomomyces lativittatus]